MSEEKESTTSSKTTVKTEDLPPHILEEIEALRDKVNKIEGKFDGFLKERK